MNRQTLADATSLHDAPVPIYLMEQIANGTKASERDAEKTVDFLLGRLAKSNLIVKLKALQILSFCVREGSPVVAEVVREEESEISAYLQCSGPPDPVMGDERYRRIRVASQELLVCLNDGCLPRRTENPAPSDSGATWGQQAQSSNSYDQAPPPQQGGYGGNGGQYGSAPPPSGQYGSQPWGSNSQSRPPPYSDNMSSGPSYGGSSGGGYNGPQGSQYGGRSGGYSGGNYGQSNTTASGGSQYGGGYGGDHSDRQEPQSQGPSGFSSWSAPANSNTYSQPKSTTGGGMWSSSGYQKTTQPAPSYGGAPSYSSRDNRPTVLVGHNLNFPKPAGYGNSSFTGGATGGNFGTGAFGSNLNNTGGGGQFGGPSRPMPSYVDNMNKMLSGPSHGALGMSGSAHIMQPDNAAQSKLGKTMEGLVKLGTEAKDRWDRRNMDKSMASSLADHDELNAGPQVLDRGYFQPHSLQKGTGGGDTSGEYERGLIDNLCASVGLARAPPADALKRFVELAQTLDHQTIGDILFDKLEDSVWQVRLKALHVVLALLDSPGSAPYVEMFEDNAGVFEELRSDAKPTVASKSHQVLRALGLVDDALPQPPLARRSTSRSSTTSRASATTAPPASNDVDFLGFDSLNIHSPRGAPPARHDSQQSQSAPNIYGSPPGAPTPAPQTPQQVSLLEGFDMVPPPQQPYQHQYHQPLPPQQQHQQYGDLLLQSPPNQRRQVPPQQLPGAADDRSKALSNFGKDLFTIANSPRHSDGGAAQPAAKSEQSAFSFM